MAKRKQLTDFPTFVSAQETFQKIERESAQVRSRKIDIENQLTAVKENPGQNALAAFLSEGSPETTKAAELREEFGRLEQRQRFLSQAMEEARREYQDARGQASIEICNAARPTFVEPINRILDGLKAICDANQDLHRLRDELESEGITTGSIPFCNLPELGSWDDQMLLGIASRYRHWIRNNFPEVKGS